MLNEKFINISLNNQLLSTTIRILVKYEWKKKTSKKGFAVKAAQQHTRWKNISSRAKQVSEAVKTITDKSPSDASSILGLKSKSYFADLFSSWQHGSNDNLNGLVRQYIPKKSASTVIQDELVMI